MISRRWFMFFLFGLASLVSTPSLADEQPPTPAQLLSLQFAEMDSMQAHFMQKIVDEKGGVLQEASGEVTVQRPRKFYWKTVEPYEHLVVANGETLWLYDIDLEQVTRQPFTDDLDRAPALILSGESDSLAQQYAITVQEKQAGATVTMDFSLVPHSDDNVFTKLSLGFVEGKIAYMTMEDSFQQVTQITFSDIEYNPSIEPGLFQFTPPAGIDVISNEP